MSSKQKSLNQCSKKNYCKQEENLTMVTLVLRLWHQGHCCIHQQVDCCCFFLLTPWYSLILPLWLDAPQSCHLPKPHHCKAMPPPAGFQWKNHTKNKLPTSREPAMAETQLTQMPHGLCCHKVEEPGRPMLQAAPARSDLLQLWHPWEQQCVAWCQCVTWQQCIAWQLFVACLNAMQWKKSPSFLYSTLEL